MHPIEVEFRSKPRGLEKLIREHGFIQISSNANVKDFKDFSLPNKRPPILYFEYGYTLHNHPILDSDLDRVNAILRIHLDQADLSQVKLIYGLLHTIVEKYHCSVHDFYP